MVCRSSAQTATFLFFKRRYTTRRHRFITVLSPFSRNLEIQKRSKTCAHSHHRVLTGLFLIITIKLIKN